MFLVIFMLYRWQNKEADYVFIDKYNYSITNKDSFDFTYLSNKSFGFCIGDFNIQGIKIETTELDINKEYIFSLYHPVSSVYTNSEEVRNQNQRETKKRPIEIIQDKSITDSAYIYVYELRPKGKYRLLLP